MTNRIDPRHPHLQSWLKEGAEPGNAHLRPSLPALARGDLAKAKATYDRCVDQMDAFPATGRGVSHALLRFDEFAQPAVLSPRSSTARTPRATSCRSTARCATSSRPTIRAAARAGAGRARPQEIFRKYLPFKSFVNTIEDYPYPYVIGRLCWEFPCVVPSDWRRRTAKAQQPANRRRFQTGPRRDGRQAGRVHAHLSSAQLDQERADRRADRSRRGEARQEGQVPHLSRSARAAGQKPAGRQPLRAADGGDNGVRLLDLDNDGYLDVVIGNAQVRQTRLWSPRIRKWIVGDVSDESR